MRKLNIHSDWKYKTKHFLKLLTLFLPFSCPYKPLHIFDFGIRQRVFMLSLWNISIIKLILGKQKSLSDVVQSSCNHITLFMQLPSIDHEGMSTADCSFSPFKQHSEWSYSSSLFFITESQNNLGWNWPPEISDPTQTLMRENFKEKGKLEG